MHSYSKLTHYFLTTTYYYIDQIANKTISISKRQRRAATGHLQWQVSFVPFRRVVSQRRI